MVANEQFDSLTDEQQLEMTQMMQDALSNPHGHANQPTDVKAEIVIAGRFEDEEDDHLGLSHYEFVHDDGIMPVVSEAQRLLITGEIPVEMTQVREVGGGNWAPYLPYTFYLDALNKLTLWNWELVIDDWFEDERSMNCSGHLVIHSAARSIRIPCDGGTKKKNNDNLTPADVRKTARTDMLKNGATWFGIGLSLKDPMMKEHALVYHGKAKAARPRDLQDLQNLMRQKPGTKVEDWELKSEKRVMALLREIRLG